MSGNPDDNTYDDTEPDQPLVDGFDDVEVTRFEDSVEEQPGQDTRQDSYRGEAASDDPGEVPTIPLGTEEDDTADPDPDDTEPDGADDGDPDAHPDSPDRTGTSTPDKGAAEAGEGS